jgi:glycosyltransferase involved in cell wall biosynthesis
MCLNEFNQQAGFPTATLKKRLLVVGPQPPPVGGGTTSVQLLLDELARHTKIETFAINTSPQDYRKKARLLRWETVKRAGWIVRQYIRRVRDSNAVLVIGTESFFFVLGWFLLLLARQFHVPFYFKPLGGDLSLCLDARIRLFQRYMLSLLRATNGVLVQTRQLRSELAKLGCANTYYVPGYRPIPPDGSPPKRNSGEFRLVFLSQIVREKGPLLLLEALRILALEEGVSVFCDFYGPIPREDQREFFTQLEATPGARYCGTAETRTASKLMAGYDALAFPTHFVGEGHSGVIIEAMHAGIPVISTQFRAIPELITDGENGFLIPTGDSRALVFAIKRLALEPRLREKMGKANYQIGRGFRSDVVVPQMLEIMLPGSANPTEPISQPMSFGSIN